MNTKFMFSLLLFISILSFTGCAPTQNSTTYNTIAKEPRVVWPTVEYRAVAKRTGSNTVSGQAFLKTRGGDVKTCAGNKVILNPVTSYSKQFVEVNIYRSHGVGVVLEPSSPDLRIYSYIKETTADADGRFKFYNVPDGEYYLYTTVLWEVPGYLKRQGGWVIEKISVNAENRNEFILSGL